MNVVLVTVDCLRRDMLEHPATDTPFLDGLRDDGLFYRNMHATATTTTPAVASFLTGLYSERNGVNSLLEAELDDDVTTLAEAFSAAGYTTSALATGPLDPETGIDRGFDRYDLRDKDANLAGDWFDEATAHVADLAEPFFLYLHLWELHRPITVPEGFDDPKYGPHPYMRSLAAVDRALERFADDLPDDTVLAVHGDHGESIAWRDRFLQRWLKRGRTLLRYHLGLDTRPLERALNRLMDRWSPDYPDHYIEDGHGENVFDFATNVPLVIAGADRSAAVDAQVRQIDLFPTLLEIAGVDVPPVIDGESLLPPDAVEDRDAYVRACGQSLKSRENWARGVRADGMKYVTYPDRDWSPELYDLTADPRELRDVDDPDARAAMADRLPDAELMRQDELDIHDRLRDLGYM